MWDIEQKKLNETFSRWDSPQVEVLASLNILKVSAQTDVLLPSHLIVFSQRLTQSESQSIAYNSERKVHGFLSFSMPSSPTWFYLKAKYQIKSFERLQTVPS